MLNKESAVSDCYEVREGGTVWIVSFRRGLHLSEEVQYEELLSLLSNVFLCRDYKDSRIWKHSLFGEFLARAFHLALEGNHTSMSSSPLLLMGWFLSGLRSSVGLLLQQRCPWKMTREEED